MSAAELATHSERALGAGAGFFNDEPVRLARGEKAHLYDAAPSLRPAPLFEREHTDAFVAAFTETARELC